ncbi:MAG TPA: deoxyribodipyrimidine photo-lyase [Gaiellaceae bacterium]|nr:deoxyribodipyrimidine photo-lyase [Gaiellaceae bacterium]
MSRSAVVLLTRDLRVHDQPALTAAAASAERVVPLFVLDDAILGSSFAAPNRVGFLLESLADLRERLSLVVRCGDVVEETGRLVDELGADTLHLSADVSAYAQAREDRSRRELRAEVVAHGGITIVPPGEVAPAGKDHYEVFSAYWRAWRALPLGDPLPAVRLAAHGVEPGELPSPPEGRSPEVTRGGETEGRRRLEHWARDGLAGYGAGMSETSRLSPYLHFGCLSAREVAVRCAAAEAFVRQVCWRDYYAQLLAARPETATTDLRPRGDEWVDDAQALEAWKNGQTGFPFVDAGMRQLAREGWMHNRARLVTASFLTKDLGIDWRVGAQHFYDLLLDGDVAQNAGNWQWVAGTGTDPRPYRVFNPTAQARKLDPDGTYIRRYVEELPAAPDASEPGLLAPDYPAPIVDHAEAVERFRRRRDR